MQRSKKWIAFILAGLAFCVVPRAAQAQVVGQPEPGPLPAPLIRPYAAPVVTYYTPPPVYLRPTAYSFNGPTAAPIGYVIGTTTYYQAPGGSRQVYSTTLTPVLGYQPGYYRDYYTPRFYRP
jgi:hypothetical protein